MPGLPGGPGEAAGGGGGATTSAVEETPPGSPQEPKPAGIIKSDPADDKNRNGTGIKSFTDIIALHMYKVLYTTRIRLFLV